jgi:predicted lipoprotein with Yx(FWY)xxD motif
MSRWISILIVCAAVLAWAIPPAAAQAALIAAQSDKYGVYLIDAVGRAVYLFTADQQGMGEAKTMSRCYDACAQAWPPLTTEGKPKAGTQAQASLLGTVQRQDGRIQVTYNGWPLYYFAKDQPQGQPAGHHVQGFGGEWYLVQPQGTKVATKQ